MKVPRAAGALSRALKGSKVARLADTAPREVVDDIFSCALKKQTGDDPFLLRFPSANSHTAWLAIILPGLCWFHRLSDPVLLLLLLQA